MTSFVQYVLPALFLYQIVDKSYTSPLDVSNVAQSDLVVTLLKPASKIRGHILKSRFEHDFYAFQDIPYAQSPIGKLRFKPAKETNGWPGILDATSNRKICSQVNPPYPVNESLIKTEDCLVLNVYTPVMPNNNSDLPVFFWIHGGGFTTGSGTINVFDPKNFIDFDIILVTINYRLGVLGFLSTDDEHIPGNLGLKDQQLALKWTHDNIKVFGGDPERITIGGESAGASSVSYHLLNNGNHGMIKGAIQESGTAITTFAYQINPKKNAFTFAKVLDPTFTSNNSQKLLDLLQQTPVETLIATQSKIPSEELLGFMSINNWKPIIESSHNTDAYITEPMEENFRKGNFLKLPTFIGFNSEESLTFLMTIDEDFFQKRSKLYDEHPELMISKKLNVLEREVKGVVEDWKKIYTSLPFSQNKTAFVKYCSDAGFIHSTIRQAELTSKFVSVYMYQFAYGKQYLNVTGTEHIGHAEELMYLWNTPLIPVVIDERFRSSLLTFWTNFIRNQNPTPYHDGSIIWPEVQPNILQYMNINYTLEIRSCPRNYQEIRDIRDRCVIEPFTIY